jgi:exonuclease SbcC
LSYRIARVKLTNIKSHTETDLAFTTGVNVIEGDVGAGKSTVLQAIEAALLGYRIKDLLRVSRPQGEIELYLEPDFSIRWRVAERGVKTVALGLDGRRVEYAAAQAREFIVNKFGLGDSISPQSEPVIFRTAVYVRQEELKSILDGGEDVERLVRRATGIERYALAHENAEIVARELAKRAEGFTERISTLEQAVKENERAAQRLGQLRKELAFASLRLESLESTFSEKDTELKAKQAETERISITLEGARQALKDTEDLISRHSKSLDQCRTRIEDLELKKSTLGSKIKPSRAPRDIIEEESRLRTQFEAVSEEIARLKANAASFERLKAEESRLESSIDPDLDSVSLNEMLAQVRKDRTEARDRYSVAKRAVSDYARLIREGKCFVCSQPIDPEEYTEHLARERSLLQSLESELDDYKAQEETLESYLRKAEQQELTKRRLADIREELARLKEPLGIDAKRDELAAIRASLEEISALRDLASIDEQIRLTQEEEARLRADLEEYYTQRRLRVSEIEELDDQLQTQRSELDELESVYDSFQQQLREAARRKFVLEGEIGPVEAGAAVYEKGLSELERARTSQHNLSRLTEFFDKVFEPAMKQLEEDKMAYVKREVHRMTKDYFAVLMQDDERSVALDQSLAPRLERKLGGRWVEMPSPSGGERSTMALAYRLALSSVARSRQGIKLGFLMLDEPTDGFSEEQLTKFKSVLERLEIPQVLLVTHHRVLESIGDNVVQLEYSDEGSRVRGGS